MSILSKHQLTNKYPTLFNKFGVNTPNRLANFFGQAMHESKLKPTVESLNYSVDGLLNTFGRHRISLQDAIKYGRGKNPANQEMIGNIIYGGEWGKKNLGNTQYGDGFKYRGRGIFQITGRSNYQALTKYANDLGFKVDYIDNPDLLLNEVDSLIGALWYWNAKGLNNLADKNDTIGISKAINLGNSKSKGTPKGLQDRINQTNYFKNIFK
jgi:putative chitinase